MNVDCNGQCLQVPFMYLGKMAKSDSSSELLGRIVSYFLPGAPRVISG